MAIRVIVACGSGVATSQTVASKVNRMLKEKKVDAVVEAVDLKSVDRYMDGSAAYITIVKNVKEYPIPVINGIAFLTGVGKDKEFEKLVKAIDDYNKKNL
ncbi:MAG: PTS sugar transporter subunit IIB [Lacrimispora sp.]